MFAIRRLIAAVAIPGILFASSACANAIIFADDFNRADSAVVGGAWTEQHEVLSHFVLPGGTNVDPGYLEINNNALAFHYVRQSPAGNYVHGRPYTYAPLGQTLSSAELSFTYTPHQNGLIQHEIGFMSAASGFSEMTDSAGYSSFIPNLGLGVMLVRTDTGTNDSKILLRKDVGGAQIDLLVQSMPFQFNFGTTYTVELTIEPGLLEVQVSNGALTGTASVGLGAFSLLADQVYFSDLQGGTSNPATPGDYILRFDNVVVRDVPEPATLVLLVFGLAGIGFSRRKVGP